MPSSHLLRNEIGRAILAPITKGKASNYIRPTIAAIYITQTCNSRCTMCDFWKNKEDPKELSSEQWGIIFSKLKAFGVGFVGVNASGEMFTHKHAFEILRHLKDLDLPFGINSNGLLFNERRAKLLAELNPRQITVGFDGVGNEPYLLTRGLKNGFTKVTQNMHNLRKAGINNIAIGSVLMRENINDWVNLANYVLEEKLDGVRFTAFHEAYFNPDSTLTQSEYQDEAFLEKVDEEIEKLIILKRKTGIVRNSEAYLRKVSSFFRNQSGYFPVPCLQGSNRIEIDTHGNVTLCSFVQEPLGNLMTTEMEDIWNSTIHQQARQDAYEGKCPHCFLSCYSEENLRLSREGFIPTLSSSMQRGMRLIGPEK